MNLLAFETSTEACSVAVHCGGQTEERFEIAPRRHAELALPWAEQLLTQVGLTRAQLQAVAVGRGPGAFTGVRLGIGLAQGIALGLDLPVLAVSTLRVLAERAPADAPRVLATIDARMGEVYAATFERRDGELVSVSAEIVCAPSAVQLPDDATGWFAVGTGMAAEGGALTTRLAPRLVGLDAQALPHAADLVALALAGLARGEAIAPERVEPAYLRDNVALTLEQQRAARAGAG